MPINCQNVLQFGTCTEEGCEKNHAILTCELCGIISANQNGYRSHMRGKKHQRKVARIQAEPITKIICQICQLDMYSYNWETHEAGKRHQLNLESQPNLDAADLIPMEDQRALHTCDLCHSIIPNGMWSAHLNSRRHASAVKFAQYRAVLDDAERDKNGIEIDASLDFGIVEPADARNGLSCIARLKPSAPHSKFTLLQAKLQPNTHASAFGVRPPLRTSMRMGAILQVQIEFRGSYVGQYEDRVEFIFLDEILNKHFFISRSLKAIVGNAADYAALRPVHPYVPRQRVKRQIIGEPVKGPPPPHNLTVPYVVRLPEAKIPSQLYSLLSGDRLRETIKQLRKVYIPTDFNTETYARHFKTLLWAEEFKTEQDLERFDIEDATLKEYNITYSLEVPGLAEKRPSVLIGDGILVQRKGETSGRWFEGRVYQVKHKEVKMRFHSSFPAWNLAQKYTVRFRLTRIPFRRQHQAMDTVFQEDRILFPTEDHEVDSVPLRIRPFNELVSGNYWQYTAVRHIAGQPPGSVPFIIFGPPGTGKTITTIEGILQVLKANPNARIIAVAPSNSAADLLVLGLGSLKDTELFRFYAPSRSNMKDSISHRITKYTFLDRNGHFSAPPLNIVMNYRVIVTTCVSSSVFHNIGVPRGHYSHIFIDEAGQATEPEAIMAVKAMADRKTNVILSGDPKQLGPIIRSVIAREFGLELSYLERLMKMDLYQVEPGLDNPNVVKLVQNYRSHPAILKYPNEHFYQSELKACAKKEQMDFYLGSTYLQNRKFPIVFYAVYGKDEQEASSPSFFNSVEALQVKTYIKQLKDDRQFRTSDSDIGVISPYHAQCLKIRNILRTTAEGVKVGSVEEFQGQERKVIIISTVRSSKDRIEYDLRHTLGFVANPRRFNVAITRAQSMLIIVGDPRVLSLDPLWRTFLNYVHKNGGWTGPEQISWDPEDDVDEAGGYDQRIRRAAEVDMNRLARRMERLAVMGVQLEGEEGEEEEDGNADRPFKEWE